MAAGAGLVNRPLRERFRDRASGTYLYRETKIAVSPDEVTERLNEVCAQIDDQADGDRAFLAAAARRLLKNVEWDPHPMKVARRKHVHGNRFIRRAESSPRLMLAQLAAYFAKLWSAVATEPPLWEGGGR
jgi:hypothetical protein